MKALLKTTVTMIATISALSACTKSSSRSDAPATQSPEAKVENQSQDLVGSFKGLSAVCQDGSELPKDHETTLATTLTFNADGTYKSSTIIKGTKEALETEGKYSTSEDILTLVKESQIYEGNIGFMNEESKEKFKLEDKDLTVTVAYNEDSSCPVDQAMIIKYQRQDASQEDNQAANQELNQEVIADAKADKISTNSSIARRK